VKRRYHIDIEAVQRFKVLKIKPLGSKGLERQRILIYFCKIRTVSIEVE